MDTPFLTRSYLETLSSADLVSLADDYDIDIPSDLNRRFIIGELLDVAEELKQNKKSDMVISSDAAVADEDEKLPDTYNETRITVLLRNPVWAYVYWDIKESDLAMMKAERTQASLSLNIIYFDELNAVKPSDSFEIQIPSAEREQYVLLSAEKKFVQINLNAVMRNQSQAVLASSRRIELPHGCDALVSSFPGKPVAFSPVMKLSGMDKLLHLHYMQHRQSFS